MLNFVAGFLVFIISRHHISLISFITWWTLEWLVIFWLFILNYFHLHFLKKDISNCRHRLWRHVIFQCGFISSNIYFLKLLQVVCGENSWNSAFYLSWTVPVLSGPSITPLHDRTPQLLPSHLCIYLPLASFTHSPFTNTVISPSAYSCCFCFCSINLCIQISDLPGCFLRILSCIS